MKNLKDLLPKKHLHTPRHGREGGFDDQTIFHIAKKVLREEYGLRGVENIIPVRYFEKKLYLSSSSSLWGNEIWLERNRLQEQMNAFLGQQVIIEIKIQPG